MKKFIKLLAMILSIATVCFVFASCGKSKYDKEVQEAIEKIKETWDDELFRAAKGGEKTIKIVNTQVILIKQNPEFENEVVERIYNQTLKDVKMVIQFEILSNYMAPGGNKNGYMLNNRMYSDVIVYNNGEYEVTSGLFSKIGATTYNYDFDDYIEKTIDLGGSYDQTINF